MIANFLIIIIIWNENVSNKVRTFSSTVWIHKRGMTMIYNFFLARKEIKKYKKEKKRHFHYHLWLSVYQSKQENEMNINKSNKFKKLNRIFLLLKFNIILLWLWTYNYNYLLINFADRITKLLFQKKTSKNCMPHCHFIIYKSHYRVNFKVKF